MASVPDSLKRDEFRFVLVGSRSKHPLEEGWVASTNYPYSHEKVKDHQGNLGILTGMGLVIADCDTEKLETLIREKLPPTLVVGTSTLPSGYRKKHFYFLSEMKVKRVLEDPKLKDDKNNKLHLGEVQALGQQCLCPSSIHPSGARYEIIEDQPIAFASETDILNVFEPYLTKPEAYPDVKYGEKGSKLDITKVVDINNLGFSGNQFFGAHPVHGSTTGQNFWINPTLNLWHCFRCSSGGDALSWIAVKEGLIDCSEAKKGALRGELFKKVKTIAQTKYGYSEVELGDETAYDEVKRFESEEWDAAALSELDIPDDEWLVDGLIPKGVVILLSGKPGALKTYISLFLSVSIATGTSFCGRKVEKGPVLFIDEDSGRRSLSKRLHILTLKPEHNQMTGLSFAGISLSDTRAQEYLTKKCEDMKGGFVVLDCFRGMFHGDENNSSEISIVFRNFLRRLSASTGVTFLLLHHLRKAQKNDTSDAIESIRGSGDIIASTDIIFHAEKSISADNKTILNLTCQRSKDFLVKPLTVELDFGSNPKAPQITWRGLDESETELTRLADSQKKVLAWAKGQGDFTVKDVAAGVNISEKTARTACKVLVAERFLKEERVTFNRSTVCKYTLSGSAERDALKKYWNMKNEN